MYKQLTLWGMLIALVFSMSSCSKSPACDPVVVVTDIDYTSAPLDVPYTNIHEVFADNYCGADLSVELRDNIITEMQEKAVEIGENPDVLYECIKATYSDWNERPHRIPCYAEKCVYESQSVWAIAFNRANSFEEASLSHFDLFFVSYATYDTLYHTGCFSTP
ncbi:hypothetical protein AMJ83_00005 [candidate division WOR_3 bacterium SM23_42]|uniref:Uncharacterized protein n=1 Tax=candidate division WOR_3 bacterium SM23_42 TaxID=1703779 RepID=A0A0S8FXN3_UNCW3|nr:MAG: hypothetical protein AMJ83_00005 [candidate division WOR_3 bacterium SM23_42]